MTKSIKKIFAVLLTLTVIFSVPVIAGAVDETFDYQLVSTKAVSGRWKDDYAGRFRIVLSGKGNSLGENDVILTFGTNETADNFAVVRKSDASVSFDSGKTVIEFNIDKVLNHQDEITFAIKDGAFKAADGSTNAGYLFKLSGNAIIESLDKEEIAVNPIEKLIIKIQEWKYGWMLYPVVLVLQWFLSL